MLSRKTNPSRTGPQEATGPMSSMGTVKATVTTTTYSYRPAMKRFVVFMSYTNEREVSCNPSNYIL